MAETLKIRGKQLTALQEVAGSPQITRQEVGDPSNPQIGWEIIRIYSIQRNLAVGVLPKWEAQDIEYPQCFLKSVVITGDDAIAEVRCVYRSPEFISYNIALAPGDISLEMDVGISQAPIETAPYFAELTPQQISICNSLLSYAKTIFTGSGQAGSGSTAVGKDESGNSISLTGKGAELYWLKIRGVEVFDIAVPLFRRTTAMTIELNTGFAFGNINLLEYPGYNIPGQAKNWRKVAYRNVDRRTGGSFFSEVVEEWAYSAAGWDTRLYPLA